uniref:Ubiquitin protein ligase E3a, putative n=1 Tax=Arundo donax TaxID=35708 RepID=A0A0A8XW18_ARUDO
MMTNHDPSGRIVEVEFEGEVGTGRGPTFEFYTTVTHEFKGLSLECGEETTAKMDSLMLLLDYFQSRGHHQALHCEGSIFLMCYRNSSFLGI